MAVGIAQVRDRDPAVARRGPVRAVTDRFAMPHLPHLQHARLWKGDLPDMSLGFAPLGPTIERDARAGQTEAIVGAAAEACAVRQAVEIGRAHVCTPVTTAHLVCRLLIEKNTFTNPIDNAHVG